MIDITAAIDYHDLHKAFNMLNEAINIKHTNPIIKGISLEDKQSFIQD